MRNDVVNNKKLENELLDLVAKEALVDRDTLTRETKLEDMDIASADFVMILMAIEENYGTYISIDNEMTDLVTVQDLLSMVTKKIIEDQS